MSKTIDDRVVSMQFDNRQFESNVQTSLGTIDKLKQSLKFTGATDGLENIDSASRRISMNPLSSAVESVGLKFNALQVMATTALMNITNTAVNAGKRIVSSLTIDPIKMGFQEYETQINAVQTILANTESKGKTLEDVNGALDELNTYADKTIYNFTEMTRNIGTFTAAGVDLDTSVSAIKGIANLAAISGSNSQQASTAMYQLSQALASGTVKLMDWNSVVNAGMGGQVFQDALKETARVHGIAIDDMIEEEGSFRETLSNGWLSAEILTETLSKFTGDLSAEQLRSMGYTEKQVEEILKLGQTANDAATKVKTFTQLMDTLKEAAQSGWTQTWEILVGDFEEAKKLWTSVSDVFGKIIGDAAEARNALLQGWADGGGRDMALESFKNIWESILSIVKPIKEAFREIFPPTTSEQLLNITKAIRDFTAKLKLSESAQAKLKSAFKGLFAVIDIGVTLIKEIVSGVAKLIDSFFNLSGGVLDIAGSWGDFTVKIRDSIKESGIFSKVIGGVVGFLQKLIDKLGVATDFIASKIAAPGFEWFFSLLEGLWKVLSWIGEKISAVASAIGNALSGAFKDGAFVGLVDVVNGGILAAILLNINKFVKGFSSAFDGMFDSFGAITELPGKITGILDSVKGCLEAYQESLKAEVLMKLAKAILILAAALLVIALIDSDKLAASLGAVAVLFGELIASMKLFSMIGGDMGLVKTAAAMVALSSAILILAVATKIMSTISSDELRVALMGISAGLASLVVAVNLLPTKNVKKAAASMKSMATALVILSLALKIMATMSWDELAIGLTGMAVGLAAMVGAVNLLPKDTGLKTLGMISFATSIVVLASALKLMATMSWGDIERGLTTLGLALLEMAVAINLLPKDTALKTLGILSFAASMVVLASALKIMATMSWEEITKSLVTLGTSLGIFAVALNLMQGTLAGSAALLIAASALGMLVPALVILGAMSWESIGKGLVAIAGAFVILGAAGYILASAVPAILGISTALLLMGAGMVAVSTSVLILGVALITLGASLGVIATGIVTLVSALIVGIIKGIGEGIIAICEIISGSVSAITDALIAVVLSLCGALTETIPVIADTLLQLVSALLEKLVEYTPTIVSHLMDFLIGVLDSLAEKLPDLIVAAMNLLMSFFTGIVEALGDIDVSVLVKAIAGLGLVAGLMAFIGSVILPLVPSAMAGIIAMGVLIAEMALVLAAVGAFAQIPGLEWLISEGGNLLQTIGIAIGQFIGGIIGGVGQGMSGALPGIGANLSEFMTNLKPFIEGAQMLNPTALEGVKSLASIILTLTAANILEGLTSWFTGGSSITKFAEDIVPLGDAMARFSSAVSGKIDEGAVTAAANAGKVLAEMANTIPNTGGVVSWFAGENDLSVFTSQLIPFGQAMVGFSQAVSGKIDEGAVTAAANAGKAMVEMADTIPNTGGVVSWFTGENDLQTFGSQIVVFGKSMAEFSKIISGKIDEGAVVAAANAGKAMAEMNATIPNTGGLKAFFSGDKDMAAFTSQLVPFGEAMVGFSKAIAGKIDEGAVTAAANAGKAMAEMSHIDPAGIETATKNVDKLVKMAKGMVDVDFTGFSKFGKSLEELGKTGVSGFIKAFSDAEDKASKAGKTLVTNIADSIENNKKAVTTAVDTLVSEASKALDDNYQDFYDAGSALVDGFAAGISENSYKAAAKAKAMADAAEKAAKDALDINSPSKVFMGIGTSVPEGFAMGIDKLGRMVEKSTESMTDTSVDGVAKGISRIADVVSSDIDTQPTIRPVLDLSDVESGSLTINDMLKAGVPVDLLTNVGRINSLMNQRSQNGTMSDVISEISKLNQNLEGMEHVTYSIAGVNYTGEAELQAAIETIIRYALMERRA